MYKKAAIQILYLFSNYIFVSSAICVIYDDIYKLDTVHGCLISKLYVFLLKTIDPMPENTPALLSIA
jgi:hypothetical protein